MLTYFLNRPRRVKQAILAVYDLIAIAVSVWGGFAIRYEVLVPEALVVSWECIPLAIAISLPIFYQQGLYKAVVRFLESQAIFSIIKAVAISLVLTVLATRFSAIPFFSYTVWMVEGLLLLVLVGGSRMLARHLLGSASPASGHKVPVAIYGAGNAGVQLAMGLKHSVDSQPLFFVDDKPEIQGHEVLGMAVHSPQRLKELIEHYGVQRILLAMPSISQKRRSEILDSLEELPVRILAVPGLGDIVSGAKRVEEVEQIGIEDLLGRTPVPPNQALMEACIQAKSVMVTGAGGSIGSELCRRIIRLAPRRLVIVDRTEFALYSIDQELRRILDGLQSTIELVPILGSTEHKNRMKSVIGSFGVQTVYHAAAYKHVPIIERNPIEGVQNNIFGTLSVAEAAVAEEVETFVLISTDKAVRPTNVMGATKRFAELILQGLSQQPGVATRFTIVRFGNVLASSGSVVPLFQAQIKRGGPVTVTDPDVERYFMTIPEAAELVIQAGSMGTGGEVFVLNMGEPVRIHDFARRMIRLAGLTIRDEANPRGAIEIQFTGLREGEKLYEELLIGDAFDATDHEMIFQAREECLSWPTIQGYLEQLGHASKDFDYMGIRRLLLEAVNGYHPSGGIQDWVWIRKAT